MKARRSAAFFVALALPALTSAGRVDIDAIRITKRVTAVRVQEPIHLDGVLDEPAWQLAEPARDFYQQQPDEFSPASTRRKSRSSMTTNICTSAPTSTRKRRGASLRTI